ncbi:MAG: CzcA family heavy metal efflux pump [Verrucomicrobiales bacterium]|jgi:CzcA family heavy metal efflux pump
MLNTLIRASLAHRAAVLLFALAILGGGIFTALQLPVEVLPDLTKPTVTLMTEAPGLAPEEVETLVTTPLENAVMGVRGVTRLRSTSDVALSLVFIEFDWGTDVDKARRLVWERLQAADGSLPEGVTPFMTPAASLMGEIMLVGLHSTNPETDPREVRTLADWTVKRRFQKIAGIAEVLNMGGGVSQIQVQPNPERMLAMDVSFEELRSAAAVSASNTTGGFLDSGPREIMVRNLGMTTDLKLIARTVVKHVHDRPVTIGDVAEVVWDVEPMRGDAAVNGIRGVILSITKSPGFDSRKLTKLVEKEIEDLQKSMPDGVEITSLFRQADFINHAMNNLYEALALGGLMVIVVLFLFLLNFRTTIITVMAMPLSFAVTLLVFWIFGISVNSMTVGGLAVAIGMVVDDAIVDVENVFRRLRENAASPNPQPKLEVIAEASREVRNSILYATVFIILVFVPLLCLTGLAGRLFGPIAIATMVSMAASFVVSLTVIPVLCSLLLTPKVGEERGDSFLVRGLKWLLKNTWLRFSLSAPFAVLAGVAILLSASIMLAIQMQDDFLPQFKEETALVAMTASPGTSLSQSNELADVADRLLLSIPEVRKVGRRVGRAERGDHVVPVSTVEFDIDFVEGERSRQEVLDDIRAKMQSIPGTFAALGGPLGDRIGHMLSGESAPVAIKIKGDDLDEIRRIAIEIERMAREIDGFEEARVEQQAMIPQLRIEIDRERALAYGVTPGELNDQLSALVGGETVAELYQGPKVIDLVLRLPKEWRESRELLSEIYIDTKSGQRVPLSFVANLRQAKGPNVIKREGMLRRIVVKINPTGRGLVSRVEELKSKVEAVFPESEDYTITFEGEFEARQKALNRILVFGAVILVVMVVLLVSYFQTPMFAVQVISDVLLALIGGVIFTWYMVNNISIATIVGFIAVLGIAARNSVMMISHYLHLMKHEGEGFTMEMIIRGTLERLVPVLMTALTAGIALIPLVMAAGAPGKEILHPVAVVIVGGLVTSTLLGLGVTPAVFWTFGRRSAEKAVQRSAAAAG